MAVNVRKAEMSDAERGSAVLKQSIVQLCKLDHGDEPDKISAWTTNKTPEEWRRWLAEPSALLYVAEQSGGIVGVGLITTEGQIMLNYVAPSARFQGVSKALMARMEAEARERNVQRCTLTSSQTALRFYERLGYSLVSDANDDELRMIKHLAYPGTPPARTASK